MKIAITGSSGLIGSALVRELTRDGHQVLRLVRRAPISASEIRWEPNGKIPSNEVLRALENSDVAINLGGAGVGDKRWTNAYKNEIRNSRLNTTSTIVEAINAVSIPRFISSSAIGWYGDTGNREVNESDPAGDDFLARVCVDWEAASQRADSSTVLIRTGLVLAPEGGALSRMIPLFKAGLGGKLGNGRQWWSWISIYDQIKATKFLLNSGLTGPVNFTSPQPATNFEVTAALARALNRPALLPAPSIAIRVALGGFASEVLGSKKVLPNSLIAAGYEFEYPHITQALSALLSESEK